MDSTTGNPPQPPAGQSTPPVVYLQPGQQAVYLQPGQNVPAAAFQPAEMPSANQWAYPPYGVPTKPQKSSGLRIAAGILAIALGAWNLVMFFGIMASSYGPSTPLSGWLNFLHLVGTLAVLTLGIMIIVKHRRRSKPIPSMLLGFTAALMIIDIAAANVNWLPGLATFTLAGGFPTAALAVLVLATEAAAARKK